MKSSEKKSSFDESLKGIQGWPPKMVLMPIRNPKDVDDKLWNLYLDNKPKEPTCH